MAARYLLLFAVLAVIHNCWAAECEAGWVNFEGTSRCYKILRAQKQIGGEKDCTALGGHLASINTAAENKFITGLVNKTGDPKAKLYLGGIKKTTSPANSNAFYCMQILATGFWRPWWCESEVESVCEREMDYRVPKFHTPACDDGWQPWDRSGACYKLTKKLNNSAAEKECQKMGGNLTSILSPMENEYIIEFVQLFPWANDTFWIGGKRDKSGNYQWPGGDAIKLSSGNCIKVASKTYDWTIHRRKIRKNRLVRKESTTAARRAGNPPTDPRVASCSFTT
ncbi:unnamed protein product, partial [Mesorhabditis spiculigera]